MRFLDFFNTQTSDAQLTGSDELKKEYRYWRWRIFYSMYIGYVFFYLTRKSFTFAMPAMMVSLGFTKTDLGILGSILYISYGISKFVSGMMSDRSNPRYFMSIGLILTGVFNICFGLSSSIFFFALFWGLNGWFQGWGWPPCARLLTYWYAQKERGTWWGLCSTSHNVGGAIIPLIVAVVAQSFGWRVSMYVPGVLCIMMGFVLLNRLRDTPESLGLPSIERFRGEAEEKDHSTRINEQGEVEELSQTQILLNLVFKNWQIWMLGFAYLFVYIIRTAINDWGQLFLYEYKHFSIIAASTCVFSFELGGFFGSLGAGWLSDKFFDGRRGPINALFSLFVIFAVLLLWYTPVGNMAVASGIMFTIGFFVFGPQMLIGIAAAELSHKRAAGAANGFVGWFAYFGAAAAGFPIGKITEDFGWGLFFVVLTGCSVIALMLLLPLWPARGRAKKMESPAV